MTESSVTTLTTNRLKVFDDASHTILRYTSNILKDPKNAKFRRIKTTNDVFRTRILGAEGAVQCLITMGFRKEDDSYVLPLEHSLQNLTEIHQSLINERSQRNLQIPQQAVLAVNAQSNVNQASPPIQPQIPQQQQLTPQLARSEEQFYTKLETWAQHAHLYEQNDAQAKALSVIPVDDLRSKATTLAQREIENTTRSDQSNQIIADYLLLELLHWFKNSFFTWVDSPLCRLCGGRTTIAGNPPPTTDDLKWGATRVEAHRCTQCQAITRFPRYNQPSKLLETRAGRCGEWANCFTLCCRAIGFEARAVIDWTDHVWTEVFSNHQQRWLHCDPCEDVCDKPLLYEVGWGKELSYIIAFSCDQVVDVTWRYTAKSEEVRKRRQECRENWLVQTISGLNQKVNLPKERVQLLQLRSFAEMLEFLAPKQTDQQSYGGRTSGSLAWRQARGEVGSPSNNRCFVFEPNERDIVNKKFRLRYCASTDTYVHSSDDMYNKQDELKGWDNYTYQIDSIFRKIEHDWNMVYLARTEGATSASLSWKIDLSKTNLSIESLSVFASTAIYEDGQVMWTVKGENDAKKSWVGGEREISYYKSIFSFTCRSKCKIVNVSSNEGKEVIECPELRDCQEITLSAFLSGGKGSVAWQHTQLFRQSAGDQNEYLLDIQINLKNN